MPDGVHTRCARLGLCSQSGFGAPSQRLQISAQTTIPFTLSIVLSLLHARQASCFPSAQLTHPNTVGQLEALILAAANTLEQLLVAHMVTGKDTTAAVDSAVAASTIPNRSGPSAGLSGCPPASRSTTHTPGMPPMPRSVPSKVMLHAAAAIHPATPPPVTTPQSLNRSPHTGIGVLAPPGYSLPSPELVPVSTDNPKPPVATTRVRSLTQAKGIMPVFHPPMRTGTSSVSSTKKATIGAMARKVGLEAVREHQKELDRAMKVRPCASANSFPSYFGRDS
jgi:hypothetical protein